MNKNLLFLILIGIMIPSLLFSQIEKSDTLQESFTLKRSEARVVFLKSIVLPGWGEHSLGYNRRGYTFQGAELMCWAAYAAFTYIGRAKKKDMKAFAAEHASINPSNKNKDYFADISSYDNIHQYNEAMYRNRSVNLVYSNLDKYYWDWDSENSRKDFDDLRYNSGIYLRNATLATTALVINRLISVIDIMSLTSGKIEDSPQLKAHFTPGLYKQKLTFSFDL